ncbi:hypothetical protein Taro_005446 [Colocasia esculenta]|uniref:Uncharacterized protein n=1 Tax=Colocasia esculenta TaxID=4460 RepID=A0A843TQ01_COLES|nr:hypothetical protein [Colocasia esculenta]
MPGKIIYPAAASAAALPPLSAEGAATAEVGGRLRDWNLELGDLSGGGANNQQLPRLRLRQLHHASDRMEVLPGAEQLQMGDVWDQEDYPHMLRSDLGAFAAPVSCIRVGRGVGKEAMLANFGASSFRCDSDEYLPVTFLQPRSGEEPCLPPTLVGKRWPRSTNTPRQQLLQQAVAAPAAGAPDISSSSFSSTTARSSRKT